MEKTKILLIEDDSRIARFVQLELDHEGYDTHIKSDGRSGLASALTGTYDVVLLDIMLPLISGIEVLRRIRAADKSQPVIMLTAKDDVSDKVMGLDLGADDYITKPFAIEELLARIRVILKRGNVAIQSEHLIHGKLIIDVPGREVIYDGNKIVLTKREYELLLFLLNNEGRAVNREILLANVWGYEYMGETNVVDVYVSYLRNKLDNMYDIKLIETVRGIGYIIRSDK